MRLHSLDSLRCFVAAARLLNFRNAARASALTPAAFGQRIKQLEEQLEATLFQRTTRSMTLTEAGLALLPWAERCLEAADQCARAARGETGPPPADLILGTRQELGMSWVLPQYDRLVDSHPWLSLHLYFGSGPDLLLRVRTMEIDCAITSTRLTDPKLDSVRLHREDYVFCGSSALLDATPLTRPEHAERHTLLDTAPNLPLYRYWRDAPGGGDRLRFARVISLGGIEAIRARALRGSGVAVLPEYLIRRDLKTRTLRKVFPKIAPLPDYFRLVFRAGDPRRSLFDSIAASMNAVPLS